MGTIDPDWREKRPNPGEDLTRVTAAELVGRLERREITATSVIDAHLAAIAEQDPRLRAFITVDDVEARRQAQLRDAQPASRGPLHGVPVAVKDLTDTAGLRTTCGSRLFEHRVPEVDDLAVIRLKAAGAIVIGKTNTPEFGFGAECVNPLCGPTANPHDLTLTSGGSSGGSAAAVAAGLVPVALGTDFGGSVRTPASFCGIVSIRPTPGLIASPRRSLAMDDLATIGVMARTIDDAARCLAVIEGPDRDDPLSQGVTRKPWTEGPIRLAATPDFGFATIAADVRRRFATALDLIAAVAPEVTPSTPDCTDAAATFKTLRAAHVRHALLPLVATHGAQMTETVRWNIAAGATTTADAYLAAEAARSALKRRFARFFASHDVLIAPAASILPWPNGTGEVRTIDDTALGDILDYLAPTFVISLVGYPVVTLPTPLEGVPFGVQLIGRPGEESLLIALARRLESEAGFRHRFPPSVPPIASTRA